MGLVWCALALLALRVNAGPRETVVTLNTVRALRQTADPFIGYSVSPQLLLNNHYSHPTLWMLRGLSPAVLRVGDEESEKLAFRTANRTSNTVVFTELQWAGLNRFAGEAGLGLVFTIGLKSDWQQLFNVSHRLGFSPSWQLGYKLTKNESSHEVGESLVQLRQTLNSWFLQHSSVLGPDFQVCDACDYNRQISDFFQEAGHYVNTVTLQLAPQESKEDDKLNKLFASVERAMTRKTVQPGRFKIGIKSQIWIAEASGVEEGYTGEFADALRWALKLGVLAHAGAHSVLRRPTQLIAPTPDYWVSLLHRRLVSRTVLPIRLSSTEPRLRVFAHCAANDQRPGAVTVWGANCADTASNVSLRVGARMNEVVVYVLTRDTWEDAEIGSTLLNGKLLQLNLGELPSLSGQLIALGRNMSVSVPPQSVFFIVMPVRAPACLLAPARGLNYDPPRWQTAVIGNHNSQLRNNAPLTDAKNKGDFELEKGGLYETAENARQSRDNVKEDLEKSSKLILESLKAHVNGYDKQGEGTQFEKLMDMTLTAINNGGSTDGTDIVQTTTEDSRDGISTLELPLSLLPTENDGNVGKHGTQQEDFQLSQKKSVDEDMINRRDQGSKIIPLSLIPPKDSSEDEVEDGSILTMSFNPGQTEFLSKIIQRNKTMEDSKIIRIKRSENNEFLVSNPSKGIEDSLLYRRIQFLRRNRNMTKVQESNYLSKNGTKLNLALKNSKVHNHLNHYSNGTKYQIGKVSGDENKTGSETLKIKNPGTLIHYHPGEFYETLGSLKLDANVSLKDIEQADEKTIDSMIENSQQKKSESKVSDKHVGEHEVERKLDESTTENVEQYFKCDDDKAQRVTSGSHDKTGNDNIKCSTSEQNKKIEHSLSKDKVDQKSDKELKSGKPLEPTLNTRIQLKAASDTVAKPNKTMSRVKREIGDISNITQILFPEGENSTKSNHSANPQIGMYVMDQSEGRKLFLEATVQERSLDKGYNTELYNIVTTEPTNVKITVKKKINKTVEEEERNPNFFLLNNLVIDKSDSLPLRRRVYSKELPEKIISKNMETALKGSNIEGFFDDASIRPPSSTPKLVLEMPAIEKTVKYDSVENNNSKEKRILYLDDQPMSTSKIPTITEESNPNTSSLLRQLAIKFSDDFKSITPTKTENEANTNRLKNNTQDYGEAAYSEDKIKSSTKSDSLSNSILGLAPAFLNKKIHNINKADASFIDNLTKNHSTDLLEGDQYPYKNTQNPLKASSSKLSSKVVQESTLPSVNPAMFDLTTQSVIISSPLQKPKWNLYSSLHTRPLPIPKTQVLPKTHITELPRASIQYTIKNDEHTLHQGRPTTLDELISKHKEKLNALKLRLKQAREKMLEAKKSKDAHSSTNNPHASVVKRSIFTLGGANKIQGEKKKIGFDFSGNNGLIKLLEDGMIKSSLPYETNSKHMTGQITNSDMVETSSEEFSLPQNTPKSLETTEKKYNDQLKVILLKSPIVNEFRYKPQFSRSFGGKEKLEKTNLDSGLVYLWELRRDKPDEHDEISRHKRKPRALHYPCMKDLFFNDYDTEDQVKFPLNNVNLDRKRSSGLSLGNNAQEKALQRGKHSSGEQLASTSNTSQPEIANFTRKKQSKKSKRSVDSSVKSEEIKLLEILTNKIIADELANDISENSEKSENVYRSMLDKTIRNAVSSKTGISRMFELAKEYQKTNPKSLEIFDSIEMKADNGDDDKTLSGKTGISRMFELAKEYQKTNPKSLEIFDSIEMKADNGDDDKTVSGKTGISRMFELAKEYQNTNPKSLEIFDSIEMKADNGDDEKSLEEINEGIEIQNDTEFMPGKSVGGDFYTTLRGIDESNMREETSPNKFAKTAAKDNNESKLELQETEKEIGNSEQSETFIDSFIKKIEVIIHDITSTAVKHSFALDL